MKCQSCGHHCPSPITRCTVCGHLTARRARSFSDSRLIEFPRQARLPSDKNHAASNVPAWRLEVSERVRQAKAKRGTPSVGVEQGAVNVMSRSEAPDLGAGLDQAQSARDMGPIVEAALTRVRPAQQKRASLWLPTIASSGIKPSASIVVAREATARALDPAEDASAPELNRLPPERAQSEATIAPTHTEATLAPTHTEAAFAPTHTEATLAPTHTGAAFAPTHPTPGAAKAVPRKSVPAVAPCTENARQDSPDMKPPVFDSIDEEPIEEIDPVDYLEAEVRKVDQSLARE